MSFFSFCFSMIIGVCSLAFAYFDAGYNEVSGGLLAIGAFWLYAGWKRWSWFSAIGILLLVALAGYGLWIMLSPGWMVAGSLGGLLAWDLSEFMKRMDVAPESADLLSVERRHIARLTILALSGLALTSVAMYLRLEFNLEWIVLLTLVALMGVTQLVGWLRRGGS